MAEIYWPFDSVVTADGEGNPVYDRALGAAEIAGIVDVFYTNGIVIPKYGDIPGISPLAVTAGTGLTVGVAAGNIKTGARICMNPSVKTITLSTAHASLGRWDAIIVKMDDSEPVRSCIITKKTGTPATTPLYPAMTTGSTIYEMCLAYVYVAPNATQIVSGNIVDMRFNDDLCGKCKPRFVPDDLLTTGVMSLTDTQKANVKTYLGLDNLASMRLQGGTVNVTIPAGGKTANATITYPLPYATTPFVIVDSVGTSPVYFVGRSAMGASSFVAYVGAIATVGSDTVVPVGWRAFGALA